MTSPFVDTKWLAEHLNDDDVKIIDGSWYLPQMRRDADAEYLEAHIPGAVRFDIDAVADKTTGLPHMVASADDFGKAAGALGLRETDTIVVYDGMGLFSAARVWWNFRIMGAANTLVLNGGFPKWKVDKHAIARGSTQTETAVFNARFSPELVANVDTISQIISDKSATQIVDMRPAARFTGVAPEPRAELQSGHMPGALNLPFTELVSDGVMKPPEALQDIIAAAGIDLKKPIVTSCGSGVTAAILNLALAQTGVYAMRLYDGSWAEWGWGDTNPVVVS